MIACHEWMVQAFNPASVLANICDSCLPTHHAPPRGTVFGPRGRFMPESEMEAVYCSLPSCFPDGLIEFDGFAEPFVPIWLIPITAAEAHFVQKRGWPTFESLLDEAAPDLFDLRRPSLVTGGA
jgi:hypothetical protein